MKLSLKINLTVACVIVSSAVTLISIHEREITDQGHASILQRRMTVHSLARNLIQEQQARLTREARAMASSSEVRDLLALQGDDSERCAGIKSRSVAAGIDILAVSRTDGTIVTDTDGFLTSIKAGTLDTSGPVGRVLGAPPCLIAQEAVMTKGARIGSVLVGRNLDRITAQAVPKETGAILILRSGDSVFSMSDTPFPVHTIRELLGPSGDSPEPDLTSSLHVKSFANLGNRQFNVSGESIPFLDGPDNSPLEMSLLIDSTSTLRASRESFRVGSILILLTALLSFLIINVTLRRLILGPVDHVSKIIESVARHSRIKDSSDVQASPIESPPSPPARINLTSGDEMSEMGSKINLMLDRLDTRERSQSDLDWIQSALLEITNSIEGQSSLEDAARCALRGITHRLNAPTGLLYLDESRLDRDHGEEAQTLVASVAYNGPIDLKFGPGQGLVGEVALSGKPYLKKFDPTDGMTLRSGLADFCPHQILLVPFLYRDRTVGVVELALTRPLNSAQQGLIDGLSERLGLIFESQSGHHWTTELLSRSRALAQELTHRTEELQKQREKLLLTNVKLADRTRDLADSEAVLTQQKKELESRQADLTEKAAQLERSSKYKSEFLANMSHELRTPLNSLLILSRLLLKDPEKTLTVNQKESVATIHDAGNDLESLIEDILDLSKIEAGRIVLIPEPVEIAEILRELENMFRPIAAESALEFAAILEPAAPSSLITDRKSLLQILKNFLSNACKFTETGHVRLRYSAKDNDRVTFSVEDTGIGIATHQIDDIFGAFQQGDGGTNRKFGGTGLGLSISSQLAGLLGGDITVRSSLGAGSTFTLTLDPAKLSVAPTPSASTMTARRAESVEGGVSEPMDGRGDMEARSLLAGRTILVVDDDERNQIAIGLLLTENGVIVSRAMSGQEALDLLNSAETIDGVLMDIMMPEMDGFETIRRIRDHEAFAMLPIIAVTAKAMSEDRDACLKAGANEYLPKPVSEEKLLKTLRELIIG